MKTANVKISKVMKKDLLTGESQYVKKSYIVFDSLKIETAKNMLTVSFYNNTTLLATMKTETHGEVDAIGFDLIDGKMRIEMAG